MRSFIYIALLFSITIPVEASLIAKNPSTVCGFLSELDLNTRGWKHFYGQEYSCSTPYKYIGSGFPLPNTLAYYVDGNRSSARLVKLVININNRSSAASAHSELLKAANVLSRKSTGQELSKGLIQAINDGTNTSHKIGAATAKVIRINWPTGKGYEVKFMIE